MQPRRVLMATTGIAKVINLQERLIRAVDARDVYVIEATCQRLAEAVSALAEIGVVDGATSDVSGLRHAQRQNEALRIRIDLLVARDRRKFASGR
jgi:hypothetical protein